MAEYMPGKQNSMAPTTRFWLKGLLRRIFSLSCIVSSLVSVKRGCEDVQKTEVPSAMGYTPFYTLRILGISPVLQYLISRVRAF